MKSVTRKNTCRLRTGQSVRSGFSHSTRCISYVTFMKGAQRLCLVILMCWYDAHTIDKVYRLLHVVWAHWQGGETTSIQIKAVLHPSSSMEHKRVDFLSSLSFGMDEIPRNRRFRAQIPLRIYSSPSEHGISSSTGKIPSGKSSNSCVICRCVNAQTCSQLLGQLPAHRVTPCTKNNEWRICTANGILK